MDDINEGGMMRTAALLAFVLACASARVSEGENRAVFAGYAVEPVRDTALAVVEEVAHSRHGVRVTDEGSVLTDGGIGKCGEHVTCRSSTAYGIIGEHWTTIEVRFRVVGGDTAVEVAIEYESCGRPRFGCVPERLASTGKLERQILDGIRSRLAGGNAPSAG
jgi:hypothetical protein